jgi:peptide/nickel transport system substrate-binding protein
MVRTHFGVRRLAAVAALALPLAIAGLGAANGQSVLRLVPQADLKNLDPVWTTAQITLNHGYMVYDVLFALDENQTPQPQMIDTYEKSGDNLVWKFKLRDGLIFSDNSSVQAKDAVASIKRWGVRMSAGQTMMSRVNEIVATGPLTFEIRFKEPFGPVLHALAEPATAMFVMREEEALTDPFQQIQKTIGSGPFVFSREEWVPGAKVVYRKNPAYKPRAEAPSGFAGAKLAKVDRVEWIYIPDPNTATHALLNGEVDIYEIPPIDLLPRLKADRNIKIEVLNKIGFQGMLRPNHLVPPFNHPKAREALLYIVDQKDYLAGMIGDRELERPCWAVFICGTPLESKAGLGDWAASANHAKAKQLLAEAGYKGERVVIMDPTDQQIIHNMTLVTAEKLRSIGVNVDLQAMDWSTLTSRRPVKEAPDKNPGGWNIFHTWGTGVTMGNPLASTAAPTPCDGKNWFGWACDEELEKVRQQFITAATVEERRLLADRYQTGFYKLVNYVPLGEFFVPVAYRTNVRGVLKASLLVLWNVEKSN